MTKPVDPTKWTGILYRQESVLFNQSLVSAKFHCKQYLRRFTTVIITTSQSNNRPALYDSVSCGGPNGLAGPPYSKEVFGESHGQVI